MPYYAQSLFLFYHNPADAGSHPNLFGFHPPRANLFRHGMDFSERFRISDGFHWRSLLFALYLFADLVFSRNFNQLGLDLLVVFCYELVLFKLDVRADLFIFLVYKQIVAFSVSLRALG